MYNRTPCEGLEKEKELKAKKRRKEKQQCQNPSELCIGKTSKEMSIPKQALSTNISCVVKPVIVQ